ncbi:MAG: outer membrane protein assembly factor BamA, partial [Sphingomonas sp.]
MLSGVPVWAQVAPAGSAPAAQARSGPPRAQAAAPASAPTTPVAAPVSQTLIKTLRVEGSQRIEPETVLSYTKLRVGIPYTAETLDQALKDLQASDL